MAQENIDFGSFPNDPDADAIRSAFQKVQNNFSEIYSITVSTGVVSIQPGTGITINQPQGNIVVTANLHSITIQTSNNMRVGIGSPTASSATIISGSTPFTLDLARDIRVNSVTANFLTGVLTANSAAQPNITSVGNLTSLRVIGPLDGSTINANDFVGGTFTGNFRSPGANTEIIYNKQGFMGTSSNLSWDESVFRVIGDIDSVNILGETVTANLLYGNIVTNAQPNITRVGNLENLIVVGDLFSGNANLGNVARANFFIGNGHLMTGVLRANVANFTENMLGGAGGQILYQTDINETDFTPAGNTNQVLFGNGTSAPRWVNGTISGVLIGNNLSNLVGGNFITGNVRYNGSSTVTFNVNATSAPTASTIVSRNTDANVEANNYIGNNVYAVLHGNPGNLRILGGLNGEVLTTDGTGNLIWAKAGSIGAGGPGSGIAAAGNNKSVQFNDNGNTAGHANLTWDIPTETLFATNFSGNGNGLSHIWGPNVANWVPNANRANHLVGGTGGVIPFQEQPNTTGFTEVGSLNDALLSTGTGKPKWVAATISGIYLNNNLANLTVGNFLIGNAYNGNAVQTWSVNATHAPTPNTIVARDSNGNFSTNEIFANSVIVFSNADSISSNTGALQVKGGLGVLGNMHTNGNITVTQVITANTFVGNFQGNLVINAPNRAVLFMNDANTVKHNADFFYDETQLSLHATNFRGNGTGLANIDGANIISQVANANFALFANKANFVDSANKANHINGGVAGGILYQSAIGETAFANGTSGQVLLSGGTGAPTWANGTISGVKLGENLRTLSFGSGLTPAASTYNGNAAVSISVDLDVAATANKIVIRDPSGNINAGNANLGNAVRSNFFVGNLLGSIVGGFMPSAGNGASDGITFPQNPAGGTSAAGDVAYMRYFPISGDDCILELGIANDPKDYINFNSVGGIAVNKSAGKDANAAIDALGLIKSDSIIVAGDTKSNTFTGNGAGLTGILKAAEADKVAGANVTGKVANAIFADTTGASLSATNLTGGSAGAIPYQTAPNVTAMLSPGPVDSFLASNGPGVPKWINGAISGVRLGNNLFNLANGNFITGGSYNGSGNITFAVNATPAATANTIVSRDANSNFSAGNITATTFTGNLAGNIVGGNVGTIVFQSNVSTTAFLPPATVANQVVMWNNTTKLPQWSNVTLASLEGGLRTLSTGYGLAGGIPGYNGTGNITFTVDATPLAIANSVANRDANGSIRMATCFANQLHAGGITSPGLITGYWNLAQGSRLTATYADLAEYYAGDQNLDSGTVVEFGGKYEVTLCDDIMSRKVAGVVTTNPAYLMNSQLNSEFPIAVALQGRVPVKVKGTVSKGDMMVSAGNGEAMSCSQPTMGSVIGKSLVDFTGAHGVIEIAIGRL